ncbi:UNVERIFIED_CONTAM: Non-specific lipid-transfer protein [Sesamum radiatum]|uniref:Non-specific lipid-transfer protein n=1 Tax=Sesamum radiatum TaxID=300843 RepID=A0AAW2R6E0_SESRA
MRHRGQRPLPLHQLRDVWWGGAPPATCCTGIKTLYNQASTTADRQAVCGCLKSVAGQASPTIIGTAAALPAKCGVSIPYEISPSTDCSKVH